jgi:MoxR-like ATPase
MQAFQPAEAQKRIESLTAKMKSTAEKLEAEFVQQIDKTIAAVEKDQSVSKYISDPGFTNAIQILLLADHGLTVTS